MTEEKPPKIRLTSSQMKDGPDRAPARAMLRATGLDDEAIARPLVAVVNTWSEVTPCNFHLRELADPVKAGIREAGGTPIEFNTIVVTDGITMGTAGMRASLMSRETIADSIAHYGTTNWYYQNGGYIVAIAPEHMSLVGAAYGRDEVRTHLYELATRPTDELRRIGRIPERTDDRLNVEPGRPRSPMSSEGKLMFLETGGDGGKFSAIIPGWVGNTPAAQAVTPAEELKR